MPAGVDAPRDVPKASGPVCGDFVPPGSKSLTQRWLLLAALADGDSVIENALQSDDVQAMVAGLVALGAQVVWRADGALQVRGVAGRFPGGGLLHAGEGGTPARFLMAAAARARRSSVIDGSARLRLRPMQDGAALLNALGAQVSRCGEGELPLRVEPDAAGGRGGTIRMKRPSSSQFLSAVALTAPWMPEGLRVEVEGGMPSDSYVALTVQCLRSLGVVASWDDHTGSLQVEPALLQGFHVRVEPDASSAAYGFALAAIVPGSRVRVPGLRAASAQPDLAVVEALRRLGARVESDAIGVAVCHAGALRGGVLDAGRWPDGSLAVMAAAATAVDTVELRGLATLADKESDRIACMRAWLEPMGVQVEHGADWMRIRGPVRPGAEARVDTRRDHRIAMSAAVLGAACGGVRVHDPACVSKSWPGFWTAWANLLGP